MEMYIGGYDVTAFWDNHDGGHLDHDEHMLMASAEDYRFNPVVMGMEMLATATNHTMLAVTTSNPRVHGFAARSKGGPKPYLRVYLMNKLETSQVISLQLQPGAALLTQGEAMVDTDDHWGARVNVPVTCKDNRVCDFTLPPVSFAALASAS